MRRRGISNNDMSVAPEYLLDGGLGVRAGQPFDQQRVIPSWEFVVIGRLFPHVKLHLARCPCYEPSDAGTRYARICLRVETQTDQYQPLVRTVSLVLKRLAIRVTGGRGGSASAARYSYNCFPMFRPFAHPRVTARICAMTASLGTAQLPRRPRRANTRTTVALDERNFKLVTLAV